jgi:hypothetical protein
MSLVDDVTGALPFLREQAESLMVDSCTVQRSSGTVTNPDTGVVYPNLTTIYTGKCKIQKTVSQPANPEAGEHQFTLQDSRWDTPVTAGPFLVGDVVTVTASAMDAQLVGCSFRVVETFHKSAATAQRVRVVEVVS